MIYRVKLVHLTELNGDTKKKSCEINTNTLKDCDLTNEFIKSNNMYEHLLNFQSDDSEELNTNNTATATINNTTGLPPIYASEIAMNEAIDILKGAEIEKFESHLKQRRENNIAIFAHDIPTYNKINEILNVNNTQYFTYTPKFRRPKSLILKGIKGNYEAK